jgi:hypothetical protein
MLTLLQALQLRAYTCSSTKPLRSTRELHDNEERAIAAAIAAPAVAAVPFCSCSLLLLLRTWVGFCVRASNTWYTDSRHVTMNLFMGMSLRSNDNPHTPFFTFVSQRSCTCGEGQQTAVAALRSSNTAVVPQCVWRGVQGFAGGKSMCWSSWPDYRMYIMVFTILALGSLASYHSTTATCACARSSQQQLRQLQATSLVGLGPL